MKDPRALPRSEPRWHASLAVVCALMLYITLPPRLIIGPSWVAAVLILLVLLPLSILAPRRHRETRGLRFGSIILIALVNFFNLASVLLLIAGFFNPEKARMHSAAEILRTGSQIWVTNILVFALWYWELDGDGPDTRAHANAATEFENADFLFPQMQMTIASGSNSRCIDPLWKPQFVQLPLLVVYEFDRVQPGRHDAAQPLGQSADGGRSADLPGNRRDRACPIRQPNLRVGPDCRSRVTMLEPEGSPGAQVCGYDVMAACDLPKVDAWVRFPLPAPRKSHYSRRRSQVVRQGSAKAPFGSPNLPVASRFVPLSSEKRACSRACA